MNQTAIKLHMKMTKYTNPHGLVDRANHSTANEIAHLSSFAMKNTTFRKIVSTKTYKCQTYFPIKKFQKMYPISLEPPN